ncbi:hypothetical protein [Alkaliphilus oremlandii]|nr:hypothetical protein [Alkaliphilus oremlandii]
MDFLVVANRLIVYFTVMIIGFLTPNFMKKPYSLASAFLKKQ